LQICSKCYVQSPDAAVYCENCKADLNLFSTRAVALKRMQENPRVSHVILQVADNSCPACQQLQGDYPKENPPRLPVKGCSHADGCRCFYQPVLNDIFP
jgi:hypothetical protein